MALKRTESTRFIDLTEKSTPQQSPPSSSFNIISGHLSSCNYTGSINKLNNGLKPTCCYKTNNGSDCSNQLCYLGCLRKNSLSAKHYGYCDTHWKTYCSNINNEWSDHLSYCANIKCDQLKFKYDERTGINGSNIFQKIGFPNNPNYHHVKDIIDNDSDSFSEISTDENNDEMEIEMDFDYNDDIELSDIKIIDLTLNNRGTKRKAIEPTKILDLSLEKLATSSEIEPANLFSQILDPPSHELSAHSKVESINQVHKKHRSS